MVLLPSLECCWWDWLMLQAVGNMLPAQDSKAGPNQGVHVLVCWPLSAALTSCSWSIRSAKSAAVGPVPVNDTPMWGLKLYLSPLISRGCLSPLSRMGPGMNWPGRMTCSGLQTVHRCSLHVMR
jgi:hypothetical protein